MSLEGQVSLLWAAHKNVPRNWHIPEHQHCYWQAVCVIRGNVMTTMDNQQRPLQQAQCALFRARQTHSLLSLEPSEFLEAKFFIHNQKLLDTLAAVEGFVGPIGQDAVSALKRVVVEGERRAPFYEEISTTAAEEFLWYIARNAVLPAVQPSAASQSHGERPLHSPFLSDADDVIQSVVEYMQTHLANDIALETLSRHFGYNPTYLCEKFAARVGRPPMQYLGELRIGRAQYLLVSSQRSVREIAFSIGYKSEQHFSRVFKKKTGLSPHRFRVTQRTRCIEICFVDRQTATGYGIA